MSSSSLDELLAAAGGRLEDVAGVRLAVDFGDPAGEYQAAAAGAALYWAGDRGVIDVTGKDRAAWLHNLTTNAVKTLQPGEGNYAFACNVKGRILFDLNILVLQDRVRLDVDRRLVPKILAHLDKYIITEDVTLTDRSADVVRIALFGPQVSPVAAALGVPNAPAMASLGSTQAMVGTNACLTVRHDFAGVLGLELYVDTAKAADGWHQLIDLGRVAELRPVGRDAVNILRIEAGIPWYGADIDEDVLPAETQQIERAISFQKGCYLGQEIVERMRSRGQLARRLVGLRFADGSAVRPGAGLQHEGRDAGRVTSVCRSPALNAWIGLGYARIAWSDPGTRLTTADFAVETEVLALPPLQRPRS